MKALSIQQPWAWAVAAGYKPVENRDWHTRFRGRVLIHAGKKELRDDVDGVIARAAAQAGMDRFQVAERYANQRSLGAIIGAATVTDCVTEMDSPWFFGRYGFILADPVMIAPIPCRGKLGFFDVPDDVAAKIREVSLG